MFFKSANVARYTYNWALSEWEKLYQDTGETHSAFKLITQFNKFKKEKGNEWLTEVSQKIPSRAIMDLEDAFMQFFNKSSGYPRFHSYRQTKPSFFVRTDTMRFTENKVKFEKLGFVKYLGTVDTNKKFYNGRAKFDGVNWYLTICYEVENPEPTNDLDNVIGIDLGINNLAILSDGTDYPNINKLDKMRKIDMKRVRLSKSQSRKYRMNNKPNEFRKTKNVIKTEKAIAKTFIKQRNIRVNYINHVVKDIMDKKPTTIVTEGLSIKNLSKNKYLKESIEGALWGEFLHRLKTKCDDNGIILVQVDRFYPSSKKCSTCGNIKGDLELRDRTYTCDTCGLKIDRDLNAALNLKNYAYREE